jgi:hypothetical protein
MMRGDIEEEIRVERVKDREGEKRDPTKTLPG